MKFPNVCPSTNQNSPLHKVHFDFKCVNESEIELVLKTINVRNTAGVDNITARSAKT